MPSGWQALCTSVLCGTDGVNAPFKRIIFIFVLRCELKGPALRLTQP